MVPYWTTSVCCISSHGRDGNGSEYSSSYCECIPLSLTFCMTQSQIPVASSWTVFAGRFIDPSIGFAVSWSYWFNIITGLASELIAAANVVAYWNEVREAISSNCGYLKQELTYQINNRVYQLGLCQSYSG